MEIVEEWSGDPERPIFLVDETRRALPSEGDELIVFNCVVMEAREARSILRRAAAIRRTIGMESFKGHDFARPETQQRAGQLIRLVADAFRRLRGCYRAATTASGLKLSSRSVKVRITVISDGACDRPRTIEGRELPVVITLIKAAANSLNIGARQVDVIVDRSDQLGVGPKKRRLPGETFEVLGPGQFNVGPHGRPGQMACAATFRIIADSDQGPFRDLLLLPDFYGYLQLRNQPPQAPVERLKKEPVIFAPLDVQGVWASE